MGKVYSAALDRTLLPPSLVIVYYYFATVRFLLAYFALHPPARGLIPVSCFIVKTQKRKAPSDLTEGADQTLY